MTQTERECRMSLLDAFLHWQARCTLSPRTVLLAEALVLAADLGILEAR